MQGQRLWSKWLGPPVEPMLGYHTGNAASPILIDGVLLAPYVQLRGLNPDSGEVLWHGPSYRHYGTPAVTRLDGAAVVVTPGGDVLRVRDGMELMPKLEQIEFVGPVIEGPIVYLVGWTRDARGRTSTRGSAYRLESLPDGGFRSQQLWQSELSKDRLYATPLIAEGRIFLQYQSGRLQVLDATNGRVLSHLDTGISAANGSPSPVLGAGRVVLGSEAGSVMTFSFDNNPELLGQMHLEGHLSTPLLDGEQIFVRGFQHLFCFAPSGNQDDPK